MNREVLVSVNGLHMSPESESDTVEVIAPGEYFLKNGKHFVLYDEAEEGQTEVIKNVVKISPECVEVNKKGPSSVNMIFEKDKKHVSYYYTPFGSLHVGIETRKIDVTEEESRIKAEIDYALDINYEHVADCSITIDVREKKPGEFKLC